MSQLEQWLNRGGRIRKKGLFQFKIRISLFLQCHIVASVVKNILCFYGFCLKKRNELILIRKKNEAVMLWGYLRKNILPKTADTIMNRNRQTCDLQMHSTALQFTILSIIASAYKLIDAFIYATTALLNRFYGDTQLLIKRYSMKA